MAEIIDQPITSLDQNWNNYKGSRVREFIQQQLKGSFGYNRVSASVDANSYYHIESFRSQADATLYDSDPTTYAALKLNDMTLPISTISGDSYAAQLNCNRPTGNSYVVKDGSTFTVGFRYSSVHIIGATSTSENYGANGTLVVERSINNGSSWTQMEQRIVRSSDLDETTYPISIDLGSHLAANTQNLVRVRVSFQFTDESGQTATRTSSNVTFSINSVNLSLESQVNYNTPIQAEGGTFPVSYHIFGAVVKTLHLAISGNIADATAEYNVGDTQYITSNFDRSIADTTATGILSHGVHTVRAWLTCSDGAGGTLTSDVQVNRYMVINQNADPSMRTQPFILLQNVISRADNYAQVTLCGYSVFNPVYSGGVIAAGTDPVDVSFLLTGYSEDPLNDDEMVRYLQVNERVTPGQRSELVTTIEIEGDGETDQDSYTSYFRVWRAATLGGSMTDDFLDESIGVSSIEVEVDNSDSFAPTSGRTFFINPKVRNNSETNFRRILNAASNNAVVASTWTGFSGVNDGWITNEEDNQRVLRVLAGQRINIQFNPFAQFSAVSPGPESSMTLEFDMAVRNVTDPEDAPVIRLFETSSGGNMIGLRMDAMHGYLLTASNGAVVAQNDWQWEEDRRTHISININHNVVSEPGATPQSLVRVFIDGKINREFAFSKTRADEFGTGAMSNGGITIGSDTADVDIYSISCWGNKQLSSRNVEKNYISTLPTTEEKRQVRYDNDLTDNNGLISAEKVKAHGKRVLIWHGTEPYQFLQSKQKGYWEVMQYNADGTVNADCSGTLCKQSYLDYLSDNTVVCLEASRQGSTANTYYYSNIQTKMKDVEALIAVAVADIHSSIAFTDNEDGTAYLEGGNITGDYDYDGTSVMVPDGWVDTNGKYRGKGFQVAPGLPLGQKLVNKINYASCMQSHLQGGVRSYNDLHTAIVGKNSLQQRTSNARVAKYTEPFFFFVQEAENSDPVYRGPCTFGPGKMDDVTWGFDKSIDLDFIMIEGAENNSSLSDMRVPFDHKVLPSIEDGELVGWAYPVEAKVNLDMDKCVTQKVNGVKVPRDETMVYVKGAWNFLYWHNSRIKYYLGTASALVNDSSLDNTYAYWVTQSDGVAQKYELYRWEELTEDNGHWVKAGMWDSTLEAYAARNLSTDPITSGVITAENANQFAALNEAFIQALAVHAKAHIAEHFNVRSLQFHYAYVNFFIGGTDNCSKNTYYVLDPVTKLFELHQDDLDTIFATDNNGRQTKPYYIDRQHPYADDDPNNILYEGSANVLFNLCELMYEATGELASMMSEIFSRMVSLVGSGENVPGVTPSQRTTVWGFMHKYFFSTQYYFPAIAYNEAARIRYEYPASTGFVSTLRQIPPLTQSLGDQLSAERQFMKRRLIYAASYAAWGDFSVSSSQGSIGIEGSADTFALQAYPNPDGTAATYAFDVIPHQYLYPTGSVGSSATTNPHVRVAPGETFRLSLGSVTGDTGMAIYGANYYRSFGNIGNISTKSDATFTLVGKRLTSFLAEPTVFYTDSVTGARVPAFRPAQMVVNADRLQSFSVAGCLQIGGILDASRLTRLTSFDVSGTKIYNVQLPKTEKLETVKVGASLQSLTVDDVPSLTTLTFDGYDMLTSLVIGENVGSLNTKIFAQGLYEAKVTHATSSTLPLSTLRLRNVDWTDLSIDTLSWLADISDITLTGRISVLEDSLIENRVTFVLKDKFNKKWGNVDDPSASDYGGLRLIYNQREMASATINGNFYPSEWNDGQRDYPFGLTPNSQYVNAFTKVKWSLYEGTGYMQYSRATIDEKTGVLHVESLSPLVDKIRVIATITRYYNGSYQMALTVTKDISLFNRQVQLGDLVYADGTYADPDTDDNEKTAVGVCVFTAPRDSDGDIISSLFDPADKQTNLMVSLDDVKCGSDGDHGSQSYTSFQWGNYYLSSSTLEYNLVDRDGNQLSVPSIGMSTSQFYNIADIVDITSAGLSTGSTITGTTIRDEQTTEGVQNAGFRVAAPNTSLGDGFAYDETSAQKTARTLTSDLAALAGDGYHEGDMVNSGYAKTLKIIAQRNKILNAGIPAIGLGSCVLPSASRTQTELTALANLIYNIRQWATNEYEDTYPNKWSQLYYPAASAAYAYEPTGPFKTGEVLADKFKCHNWFLPSGGLLARMYYWYARTYNGGATHNPTDSRNSTDNIFKKALDKGKFTNFSAGNHWAATEYGSGYAWNVNFGSGGFGVSGKYYSDVVRAVAAF